MQINKVNLSKFFNDPEWVVVEDIIKDCFSTLKYLPDENTSPEDFKAQVLANKKLKEAVDKFLQDTKIMVYDKPEKNPWN